MRKGEEKRREERENTKLKTVKIWYFLKLFHF